jgi:hypothetical protein
MVEGGLDSSASVEGPVSSCHEHGNETSVSTVS